MHPNGYGFLRAPLNNYARLRTDPFVPGTMIEKFKLRQGLKIKAIMQQTRRSQGPRVKEILDIEGMKPEDYINIQPFENLTAINPEQWLRLEVGQQPITNRVIDLLAPLGRGQRLVAAGLTDPIKYGTHGRSKARIWCGTSEAAWYIRCD